MSETPAASYATQVRDMRRETNIVKGHVEEL